MSKPRPIHQTKTNQPNNAGIGRAEILNWFIANHTVGKRFMIEHRPITQLPIPTTTTHTTHIVTIPSYKEITQRVNKRRGSERGDPRVDLCNKGFRVSINVSHLAWMVYTKQVLPPNFEIHHIDENPLNNHPSNLIAVHKLDHLKLHTTRTTTTNDNDNIPF